MSKKTITKRTTFTFDHVDQVEEYGKVVANYTELQTNFDSRAEENLDDNSNLIDDLQSETPNATGANTIGSEAIMDAGIDNVGDELKSAKTQLDAKTDDSEVLTLTNTTSYTPTDTYHPSTKKYADDLAIAGMPLYNALEFYQVDATGTSTQGSTVPTDNATDIGDVGTLNTTATTVVPAINEVNTLAGTKSRKYQGNDDFPTATTTHTVTAAACTVGTLVDIYPQDLDDKIGTWLVEAFAGSFDITTDTQETSIINFEWKFEV